LLTNTVKAIAPQLVNGDDNNWGNSEALTIE